MKKTIVINLLGGSGLGKSTTAAELFAAMKKKLYNVELVREYVKEWAWAGRDVGPFGQSIIYGNQIDRESALYGKVDYIITDSPLLLCPIYQNFYAETDTLKHQVFNDLKHAAKLGVTHLNFVLDRNKPFIQDGRWEDETTAKAVDAAVTRFLDYHKIDYTKLKMSDEQRISTILGYLEALKA